MRVHIAVLLSLKTTQGNDMNFICKHCLTLLSCCAVFLISTMASATSVESIDFDEAITSSHVIIVATAEMHEFERKKAGKKKNAFTKVKFKDVIQIDRSGLNLVNRKYVLKFRGGLLLDTEDSKYEKITKNKNAKNVINDLIESEQIYSVHVSGSAVEIEDGMRYLMFLNKPNNQDEPIVGFTQGIYIVDEYENISDYFGVPIIGIEDGRLEKAVLAPDLSKFEDTLITFSDDGTRDILIDDSRASLYRPDVYPLSLTEIADYIQTRLNN